MKFDFSSLFTMTSYDKEYQMNVSIYLGTVYFSIFSNKKLVTKLTISEAFLFSIIENFRILKSFDLKKPILDELYSIKIKFSRETKQKSAEFVVGIGKDIEIDKYNPFYIRIVRPDMKLDIKFPMKYPGSISNNKRLFSYDGIMGFEYYKYLFTKKIPRCITLSFDEKSSRLRKEKINKGFANQSPKQERNFSW